MLIVPQTRTHIQIFIHKGIALINPVSSIAISKRENISSYYWELIDEKGYNFNFNTTKGKVVVINFWATWCPPCIAEMPSLQKLYDTYKDDVEFLFITDDSIDKIKAFKQKNNYSFPIYIRRSNGPKELITRSIPRTLLINKERQIVIDKSGAADWFSKSIQSEIEELIMK